MTTPPDLGTVALALAAEPMLDALFAPGPLRREHASALEWLLDLAQSHGAFADLTSVQYPDVVAAWSSTDNPGLPFVLTWYDHNGARRASETYNYRRIMRPAPISAQERREAYIERVLVRLRLALGALELTAGTADLAGAQVAAFLERCTAEGLDRDAVLAAALRRRK